MNGKQMGVPEDGGNHGSAKELKRELGMLEALLFAADEPLDEKAVTEAIPTIDPEAVAGLTEELERHYRASGHGIRVQRVAGGWRLTTRPEDAEMIKRHLRGRTKMRLSKASLETISIIAYRQPLSRLELEEIRGVDSRLILKRLLERDLIRILGRAEAPGRPLLYGTTRTFLTHFGLESIQSLPKPEELFGVEEMEEQGSPVRQPQGPFLDQNGEAGWNNADLPAEKSVDDKPAD